MTRLAATLRPDGLRCVLLTSLDTEETPRDHLDLMVAEAGRFHLLRTPRLPVAVNGAGDADRRVVLVPPAATPAARWRRWRRRDQSVHGLLKRTAEAGSREILTVAAQDEFVRPSHSFTAVEC